MKYSKPILALSIVALLVAAVTSLRSTDYSPEESVNNFAPTLAEPIANTSAHKDELQENSKVSTIKEEIVNNTNTEQLKEREVKTPEQPQPVPYKLPPQEALEEMRKLALMKEKLISRDFSSLDDWSSAFDADDYSEWGYNQAEEFNAKIQNEKQWETRDATVESIECRTSFCQLSFSYGEETPVSERNKIYPDLFRGKGENITFTSYYDEDSGRQYIYGERCLDC